MLLGRDVEVPFGLANECKFKMRHSLYVLLRRYIFEGDFQKSRMRWYAREFKTNACPMTMQMLLLVFPCKQNTNIRSYKTVPAYNQLLHNISHCPLESWTATY
jgi:hypothetical protein